MLAELPVKSGLRSYGGLLQIQKKGINYQDLVKLVEKLEDLC